MPPWLPRVTLTSLDTNNLSTNQLPCHLPCPDSAYSTKPFLLPTPVHNAQPLTGHFLVSEQTHITQSSQALLLQGIRAQPSNYQVFITVFLGFQLFLVPCATVETDVMGENWRFAFPSGEVVMAAASAMPTQCSPGTQSQAQQTGCQHCVNGDPTSSYCFARVTSIAPGPGWAKSTGQGWEDRYSKFSPSSYTAESGCWAEGPLILIWLGHFSIYFRYIFVCYVIPPYFMDLIVYATDFLPASLQLFLITSAVPGRFPLQQCLAERGAYVRGASEAGRNHLCLIFYQSPCSNVYKASPMVGKFRINYYLQFPVQH